jgi:uncharacterized protein (TIGR03086 family)
MNTANTALQSRYGSAVVTLPSDTEILITRSFDAPAELVWEAVTTPRHVLRWWGPPWAPLTSAEIDLRVGGAWRYVRREVNGTEMGWHGTYREIERPHRVVSTEVYEGFPDAESVNTMTLVEIDGVTTLRTLVQHANQEFRDGHIASGMEGGMQQTFNRLDDLLAISDTPAERFRRVAGRFSDRVSEVSPAAWDQPAPPEGWTVRDVVRHLVEWVPSVIGRSGLDMPPGPSVDDDPGGAWAAFANTIQGFLDDPDTAAIQFDVGPPGVMTLESAVDMLVTGDVLVHTWDVARGAGLDEALDPIIVPQMLAGMEPIDEMLRSSGHYGPRVDVPATADVTTKLIAFTGRQP